MTKDKKTITTAPPTELAQNTKELNKVEKELKKQNSFSQAFLRGLVAALGATLGLAIVLSIFYFVVDAVSKRLGIENFTNELFKYAKR